jgi:hypothetical protein
MISRTNIICDIENNRFSPTNHQLSKIGIEKAIIHADNKIICFIKSLFHSIILTRAESDSSKKSAIIFINSVLFSNVFSITIL